MSNGELAQSLPWRENDGAARGKVELYSNCSEMRQRKTKSNEDSKTKASNLGSLGFAMIYIIHIIIKYDIKKEMVSDVKSEDVSE